MDQGELVPDELVVQMVIERLARPDADRGVLLDGFPRTLTQARALDVELAERGGGVTAAIFLDVPTDVLVERLSGRRVCIGCQSTFHVVLQQLPFDGTCPRLRRSSRATPRRRPERGRAPGHGLSAADRPRSSTIIAFAASFAEPMPAARWNRRGRERSSGSGSVRHLSRALSRAGRAPVHSVAS